MKRPLLLSAALLIAVGWGYAQQKDYWKKTSEPSGQVVQARTTPPDYKLFSLDLLSMVSTLNLAPSREIARGNSSIIITFPNPEGKLEKFKVVEASVFHPELAAKYPGIKSYAGQGIDDPTAVIRFSVSSQLGFHGMVLSGTRKSYYIDPYSADHTVYKVYGRERLNKSISDFECLTNGDVRIETTAPNANGKTNDKKFRKYRLALSCTAEYGNTFAGSGTNAEKIANILAQMNLTMTRVNGVFERDFAVTMEIIPNNDLIIYFGNTSADPWSNEYNTKTQQVIDATIGDANYDIGHNFNTIGGGNAGCIACVCTSGSKGSGYTGTAGTTPGDEFDIDYVAHEMGHQFGGYHVQSNLSCRSGSGATEVEPGSGSTIMSYSGVCSANVQINSDAYFAYVNIRDVSANVQTGASSGCPQIIDIANNPPTANAGLDYTIPKSTAFVLKGAGTDPDGDVLTYTWEQNDPGNPNSNSAPSSTRTVGPMFRSREGTTSPDRYMPQISDVVANNLTPTWEVIPSVGRTLNFSLVTKDNKAGGGQTNDDLMRVTVNSGSGPFVVSAPNTAVSWVAGTAQTVTWSVANTNQAPVSCQNVNILLSTDGGFTYPVTILSNTPNDGSQSITVPNNIGTTSRIKVEAADNIFYDISNVNFSITDPASCTPVVPTGLVASNITSSDATLTWNAIAGATYDVQYRVVGASSWITVSTNSNSITLSGLTATTQYEAQVRSVCTSSSSGYSASVNFTTTVFQLSYCTSKGNNVLNGYIGRVRFGTIDNVSGANAGYGNFTAQSTNLTKGTTNSIIITPAWSGIALPEGYAVWIDYNIDGDFTDAGEKVYTSAVTTSTSITGSFTVPATASTGATRLRVSMKLVSIPTSCETFNFGEVEDYTVNIQPDAPDTEPPSAPTNMSASNITATSANLSWTASTDNVGVTVYEVRVNGNLSGSPTGTTFSLTGLSPNTTYSVSVNAKDGAGNSSQAATISVTTTGDTEPPSAPTNLSASNITATSANLSWTASTDNVGVTGYEVRVNGNLNGSPTGTTFSLTGLSPSTTYSVSVNAKDGAGNSSQAATISFTTTGVPDTEPPLAPTNLSASNITATSANLSWTASTDNVGVTGYEVRVNGNLNGSPTGTTFSLTGLSPSKTYTVSVTAKDGAGNSSDAATISVTTTSDTEPPSPPTNLSASNITATSANLSWTASTDNVGVTVYEVRVNGNLSGSPTGTTFSLTGLSPNTTYSVSVNAKDGAGNSSQAATISVTTTSGTTTYCASKGNSVANEYIDRVQLGAINNLSGANAGYGDFTAQSANLTRGTVNTIAIKPGWTSTARNEGYAVWIDYNRDGDFIDAGEQVFVRPATTVTPINGSIFVPPTAALGATRLRVSMKFSGIPTSCETFSFGEVEDYTVNIVASGRYGDESNFVAETQIFPNPVEDRLFVNIPEGMKVRKVSVVSTQGNVLRETETCEVGIDVTGLARGIYVLRIDSDKGRITKKFLKK